MTSPAGHLGGSSIGPRTGPATFGIAAALGSARVGPPDDGAGGPDADARVTQGDPRNVDPVGLRDVEKTPTSPVILGPGRDLDPDRLRIALRPIGMA